MTIFNSYLTFAQRVNLCFTKDATSRGVFFRANLAISKAKKIPEFATLLNLGFF